MFDKKIEISSVTDFLGAIKDIESIDIELMWKQMSSILNFYQNKMCIQNEEFFYSYIENLTKRCFEHTKKAVRNNYPYMDDFNRLKKLINETVKEYLGTLYANKIQATISKYKTELELASIKNDFEDYLIKWEDQPNNHHFSTLLFRGHGKGAYKLIPSLFRGHLYREQAYIKEMIRNEPNSFIGFSFFEKLAKMQHYRCPTRLLDVTSNPLIALYFACSEKSDEGDHADIFVFAQPSTNLHMPDDLPVKALSRLAILSEEETESLYIEIKKITETKSRIKFEQDENTYKNKVVEKIYQDIRREDIAVERALDPFMFLEPLFVGCSNVASRLKAQSGSFILAPLLPKGTENPMDDLLKKMSLNITIPEKHKNDILKDLDRLCINEYTVYSDLESLSRSLTAKPFL